MSALLKISGAVLAILGLVLGAMTFISPGKMDVYGIKLDTAAILLVGGILAMGLGGVIDAARQGLRRQLAETVGEPRASAAPPEAKPQATDNPFTRKTTEAAVATTAAAGAALGLAAAAKAAPTGAKATVDPVADTITALEQAKADVIRSMGGVDSLAKPAAPLAAVEHPAHVEEAAAPETDQEAAGETSEEDLFVVEEKVIRGRPARILSDDTVEAETDEGWMRFENLDHLNEYLDSVDEQGA